MVRQIGTVKDPVRRIRLRQGNAIRQVRKMRGLASHELASLVGVSAGAVSQWESGTHSPRHRHQIAIARVLDVPWSTLFGLDGEVA